MATITLPWVQRDSEKLSSYREKAIRLLVLIALMHIPIILGSWYLLDPLSTKNADLNDWKVLLIPPLCLGSIGGFLLFAGAAFAVYAYQLIGRILTTPWVAFAIFLGAIGGIVLGVWLHAEILMTVQRDWIPADKSVTIPYVDVEYDHTVKSIYENNLVGKPVDFPLIGNISIETPLLAYVMWPLQFALVRDLVAVGGIIGFISLIPGFGIWWERKVAGRIQSRMGPMRAGGWHGWAQSAADGIKLAFKEDYVPPGGDGLLFRLAPYITFIPPICAFIALPFAAAWVFRDLDVALIFILAMLSIEVMGVILAGWASNNKWSVYGAMREACQMVSYEIPMGMALLIPVMTAGSLSLTGITAGQDGGFWTWYVFVNPWCFLAFFLYYVASLASCKRAPFDLPESESELVAGFLTEYSGFRWSMFFFGEYVAMYVVCGLACILFLGGWMSPFPASSAEWFIANANIENGMIQTLVKSLLAANPIWFILKATFLFFVQLWIRWTLPRIRIDQVLYACVQVLLPATMIVLLGNTFWILGISENGLNLGWLITLDSVINKILAGIGVLGIAGMVGIAAYGFRHNKRLVGSLAVDQLPGS